MNTLITLNQCFDENWLFILINAYRKVIRRSDHCPEAHEILDECIYYNKYISYDEIYHLEFNYNNITEALIVLNMWFRIGETEYGNAQNILLPKFGDYVLRLTGIGGAAQHAD